MTLFEPEPRLRRRIGAFLWFAAWLGVTGVAAWLKPSPDGHGTHHQLGLAPCPSALVLSRPCPGCGLTTSWTALIHGDLPAAFQAHALGPLLYLAFAATAWLGLVAALRGKRLLTDTPKFNRGLAVGVAIFAIYGIARMSLVAEYASPYERTYSKIARSIPQP